MRTLSRVLLIGVLCAALVGGLWMTGLTPIEATGGARGSSWTVQVFNNPDLAGGPVWTGVTPSVNYTWGAGAPVINGAVTGAPADNFSVRFDSSVFFTAGNYRFTLQVDDGARVYVNNLLLINNWPGSSTYHQVQADYNFTTDGTYPIRVEYRESVGDATVILTWALSVGPPLPTSTPPGGGGGTGPWLAEYFNNLDLAGSPVFTTNLPATGINQNWGQGSPGGAVPADNFSARFTRTLNVPTDIPEGTYVFYVKADDNYRFTIDVTTLVDKWDSFGELGAVHVALLPGPHTFKLEYRERSADASVFLTWSPPNGQNPVLDIPPGAPSPYEVAGGTGAPATGTGGDTGSGTGAVPPPPVTGLEGVTQANLRIRSGPGGSNSTIAVIPYKRSVTVLGIDYSRTWFQVNYQGTIGWSYAPWIMLIEGNDRMLPYTDGTIPPSEPPPATVGVIGQAYGNIRLRSGPGMQFPRIARIIWGTRVQILGRSSSLLWYKVQYGDQVGWSYARWYRIVQGEITS
ncbi:MAG: SH3 domain-containing protein, partial [Anaerolineae bacterium]|nr:SH3 domain-containing protein [Anaerolineae bacterium]